MAAITQRDIQDAVIARLKTNLTYVADKNIVQGDPELLKITKTFKGNHIIFVWPGAITTSRTTDFYDVYEQTWNITVATTVFNKFKQFFNTTTATPYGINQVVEDIINDITGANLCGSFNDWWEFDINGAEEAGGRWSQLTCNITCTAKYMKDVDYN